MMTISQGLVSRNRELERRKTVIYSQANHLPGFPIFPYFSPRKDDLDNCQYASISETGK
jgi:hypothetical protein